MRYRRIYNNKSSSSIALMHRNASHNHYQAKDESCLCLKRFRLCSNLSCMTELSWISRGFCILPFVTKMHAVSDQMHATRPFESHLRLQQQVVANVTLLLQVWSHDRHRIAPLALGVTEEIRSLDCANT